MECPRCHVELQVEDYKGIEVDRCPACQGMWLDYHELDELEDTAMSDDAIKGMMIYRSHAGDIACPRCGETMEVFNYRGYNVQIDLCPQEHGFWLDAGEEQRVLELMQQRIRDLQRSAAAEAEWGAFLQGLKAKLFRRR
ncbi:MAG: zf-TFIIB domain-containing protein [Dehalococcoidia bacterium]